MSVFLIEAKEELEDLTETDLPWSRPPLKTQAMETSRICPQYGGCTGATCVTLWCPVGLTPSVWGGTATEAWTSARLLEACNVPQRRHIPEESVTGPKEHSVVWNARIHPWCTRTLTAVLWNQGSPIWILTGTCTIARSLPSLKTGGSQGQREHFFPFGFAQLSSSLSLPRPDEGFPHICWQRGRGSSVQRRDGSRAPHL